MIPPSKPNEAGLDNLKKRVILKTSHNDLTGTDTIFFSRIDQGPMFPFCSDGVEFLNGIGIEKQSDENFYRMIFYNMDFTNLHDVAIFAFKDAPLKLEFQFRQMKKLWLYNTMLVPEELLALLLDQELLRISTGRPSTGESHAYFITVPCYADKFTLEDYKQFFKYIIWKIWDENKRLGWK